MGVAQPSVFLCASRDLTPAVVPISSGDNATGAPIHLPRPRRGMISLFPLPGRQQRQPFYGADYRGDWTCSRRVRPCSADPCSMACASVCASSSVFSQTGHCWSAAAVGILRPGRVATGAGRRRGWRRRLPAAQAAHAGYGLPITIADCAMLPYAGGSFAAVCLWTVVEHVADPLRGLLECARLRQAVCCWCARWMPKVGRGAVWPLLAVNYDARIVHVFSRQTLRRARWNRQAYACCTRVVTSMTFILFCGAPTTFASTCSSAPL